MLKSSLTANWVINAETLCNFGAHAHSLSLQAANFLRLHLDFDVETTDLTRQPFDSLGQYHHL